MKENIKNRVHGFTLIELLVVVLIIGILTAIALPQYRLAVEQAHISEAEIALKSMADSMSRYIMEKGRPTLSPNIWEDLDITYGMSTTSNPYIRQGKYFWYSLEDLNNSLYAGSGKYEEEPNYIITFKYQKKGVPSGFDKTCTGKTEFGAAVCSATCAEHVEIDQECKY